MKKILSLTVVVTLFLQIMLCCNVVFAETVPQVVSITPSGEGVTTVSNCAVTFNVDMDLTTLKSSNIIIKKKVDGSWVSINPTNVQKFNKRYVFDINFETNTEYQIIVTNSVKSKDGVSLAAWDYKYFSTGASLLNVKEITPKTKENYTTNYTGGTVDLLYDRNESTQMTVNTLGSDNKVPTYIIIDLGKAEKLAYVKFMTGDLAEGSQNIKLEASNDPTFADASTVELAVTSADAAYATYNKEYTAPSVNDTAYRYIRFSKSIKADGVTTGGHTRIKEIYVYGYEEAPIEENNSPIQVSKTTEYTVNSYVLKGSLTPGGKVTFETDITINGDYATPKVYAAVYEETTGIKKMVAFKVSKGDSTDVSVDIPGNVTNATVKFFIVTDSLCPLIESVEKTIN